MNVVQSRNARLARISEILETTQVRSQADLAAILTSDGYSVTQATLSRDLLELGAVKVRQGRDLVYAIAPEPARSESQPFADMSRPKREEEAAIDVDSVFAKLKQMKRPADEEDDE